MPSAAGEKANKCISKAGGLYVMYIAACILLSLNIVFTFLSKDEHLDFFTIIVLVYLAFFIIIIVLTKIVPVGFMQNTFAFMKNRFGPSLFIIFICKWNIDLY